MRKLIPREVEKLENSKKVAGNAVRLKNVKIVSASLHCLSRRQLRPLSTPPPETSSGGPRSLRAPLEEQEQEWPQLGYSAGQAQTSSFWEGGSTDSACWLTGELGTSTQEA